MFNKARYVFAECSQNLGQAGRIMHSNPERMMMIDVGDALLVSSYSDHDLHYDLVCCLRHI